MSPKLEEIGDVVLMRMDGKTALVKIKDVVDEQIQKGNKKIVVDLTAVSFLDSTGIGDLVAAYTLARKRGGDIKLVSDSKQIDNVLDITRLSSVFEKFTTSEEAIKSF